MALNIFLELFGPWYLPEALPALTPKNSYLAHFPWTPDNKDSSCSIGHVPFIAILQSCSRRYAEQAFAEHSSNSARNDIFLRDRHFQR